jgi:large subunit ribosomal protein L21
LAPQKKNRCEVVYAVVRAGGRQEKVEVGTIVVLDRQQAKIGDKLELPRCCSSTATP